MVTEMIEKAIEIEGLLRIIRDGSPLPETYRMVKAKAASLAEDVNSLGEKEVEVEQAPEQVDIVITTPITAVENPEVVFTDEPAEQPSDELDLTEEDDIILTFEEGIESDDAPASSEEIKIEPTVEISVALESEPEIMPEATAHNVTEKIIIPKREKKLKSAFSLNDRFLYARELFGGDMKMFDSALDFIEGVDDYSIVEDYFFNEMDWNAENPTVQTFMEVLRGKI